MAGQNYVEIDGVRYYRSNGGGNNSRKSSGNNDQKRRSGSRLVYKEDGFKCISGWRVSRGVMYSLYARPYSKTKETKSKKANSKKYTWENWFVEITNKHTGEIVKTSGLFCQETKKLYMRKLNLMANPNLSGGGYFGNHLKKQGNYNR